MGVGGLTMIYISIDVVRATCSPGQDQLVCSQEAYQDQLKQVSLNKLGLFRMYSNLVCQVTLHGSL